MVIFFAFCHPLFTANFWCEIDEWLSAARVKSQLASAQLGMMGHYYGEMLDIMTDATKVSITFGTHIELLEVDELSALRSNVSDNDIACKLGEFCAREVSLSASESYLL
jgi:L-arabinose isomerase